MAAAPSVAAVPSVTAAPSIAVVSSVAAETRKPSVPLTELEGTKVIPTISSSSNPDSLTDSQSNASNSVATEKGSHVNVKISEKESESQKPVSALDLSRSTKDLVETEIPKVSEIPQIATTAESTATKPVEESKPPKETASQPVPDLAVPSSSVTETPSVSETPTPSSEPKKPDVIDKPIPNKAIVNLISSEMAPGSPGADSEDDLPLDVIVIKKSSKEPEPKKEPTPAPAPPTQTPSSDSIMTVNPVEAPIGQPAGVGGSMSIFDQPTVPLPESSEPNTPTANPLDLVFGPDGGDDNIFGNAGDDPSALLPDIFGPTSTPPLPTATSHSLPGIVQFSS